MSDGSVEEAYFNSLMENSDASDDDFMPVSKEEWKQVRGIVCESNLYSYHVLLLCEELAIG